MAFNLERGIFGTLEGSPNETATVETVAAALQWPEASVRRKMRQLATGGYLIRDGESYTLSHDLD